MAGPVAVTPYVRIALAVTHDLDGQLIHILLHRILAVLTHDMDQIVLARVLTVLGFSR
jgi:hypothetical protein